MKNKAWIKFIVVCLIFSTTLVGIQWYKSQYLRAFIDTQYNDNERWFHYSEVAPILEPLWQESQTVSQSGESNQITLIHFWNPDCFCHQVSHRHFKAVIDAYPTHELRIIAIPKKGTNEKSYSAIETLGTRVELVPSLSGKVPEDLPVSPSIAIFNSQGELAYFGPYGFGAFCSLRPDNFLIDLINSIKHQKPIKFMNVIGDGCFCSFHS